MQARKRRFSGYGYAVGHKTGKHVRDCQRCGRSFIADRLVPYCPSCFETKRAERKARWGGASR
jgi:hypothetical protein